MFPSLEHTLKLALKKVLVQHLSKTNNYTIRKKTSYGRMEIAL